MDIDTFLRMLAAAGIGAAIGISHDLRGKPAGLRTLGLVSLGAAIVTLGTTQLPAIAGASDALSRVIQGVIQGVLTGIGFLGAGAILRGREGVQGLTTAASVWVTAALGIICALSPWSFIAAGGLLTLGLIVVAYPLEQWIDRNRGAKTTTGEPSTPPN